MDIPLLLNFLQDNPDAPISSPWKQIYDVETWLIFYKNNESGFSIYDIRSLVNIQRGVLWDNSSYYATIDVPSNDTKYSTIN
ncbi:hypothetical protein MTR_7g023070 [Medicago truncatula]|uniref:Uncharacterized protein n=1 Tax=Medicago truncatula TaxID=3880 RepID=A0A072TWN6_MEDTR|nr:hypothetical protein MTR_7g023070 [Medicago truncatula]